jgi:hypothetical protein
MKNPLYPTKLISYDTIGNYNKCYVITLESTNIPEIFDEDINQDVLDKVKIDLE